MKNLAALSRRYHDFVVVNRVLIATVITALMISLFILAITTENPLPLEIFTWILVVPTLFLKVGILALCLNKKFLVEFLGGR